MSGAKQAILRTLKQLTRREVANNMSTTTQDTDNQEEAQQPAGEKLQKVLARLGVASRRESEQLIRDGRIKVNGQPAHLGMRIGNHDKLSLDDVAIKQDEEAASLRRVIIYNKPEGEVCTRRDPEGRPTVFERLPRLKTGRWINI